MKPIGYYVSVPADHPDHEILEKIEQEFGSHLELVGDGTLGFAIAYCASCYFGKPAFPNGMNNGVGQLIAMLDKETAFALVPFLHQVIEGRREPKK
jgi:hypothetical protein